MTYEGNLPLWLTEDITWPILWGILALGIFGFIWFVTKLNRFLICFLCVLALLVSIVVIEQTFVTDKEHLVFAIHAMAEAVRHNDADTIVQFVRKDNKIFQERIRSNMKQYHFSHCRLVGFSATDVDSADKSPQRATMRFAVWATGSVAGRLDTFQSANVAVRLDFQKTGDKWNIERYGYKPSNVPGEFRMVGQWPTD